MRSYLVSGAAALALCAALPAAAQSTAGSPSRSAPPASSTASPPASTAVNPPSTMAPDPTMPPATTSPGATSTGAAADASANAPITSGLSVKDKSGATIGQITQVKPDAGGKQTATIKMGADSFAVDTSALVVQNGAAVINSTQAELQGMIKKATPPASAATTPEATKPKTKKK